MRLPSVIVLFGLFFTGYAGLVIRQGNTEDDPGIGPVSLPSSTSVSPPSGSGTATTAINLFVLGSPAACKSANISWELFAGAKTMSLAVISVTGGAASQLITSSATVSDGIYLWDPVKVPAGQYYVTAVADGSTSTGQSPYFQVTGSDNSCLGGVSSTTTASGSSTSSPSTTTSNASTSTTGAAAVGAVSHGHTGAIAGAVVGCLVAAVLLIAALFVFRSRRNKLGVKDKSGKWGGLGSDKGSGSLAPAASRKNDARHVPSDSQAGILTSPAPEENAYGSYETVAVLAAADEKFTDAEDELPGNGHPIAPIPFTTTHRRDRSAELITEDPFTQPSPTSKRHRHRTSSSSYTPGGVGRSPLASPTQAHHARRKSSSVMSPGGFNDSSELIPMGRTDSALGNAGIRKTPRKPVPQYDGPPSGTQSVNSSTDRLSLATDAALGSKAIGEGDKGIHYLIPDLPPPQSR